MLGAGFTGLLALLLLAGCGGGGSSAPTYPLDSTINNLTATGLVLNVNGASLSVAAGTQSQTLLTATAGSSYSVSIQSQPSAELCTVADGSGTIGAGAPPAVVINCVAAFSISGQVNGLTSSGLVLSATGGTATSIAAGATQYTLGPLPHDTGLYTVAIITQPEGEVCGVAPDGEGHTADLPTNVPISCVPASLSPATVVYSFDAGDHQPTMWAQGNDGNIYGSMQDAAHANGTLFEITPAGVKNDLGPDGLQPESLIPESDGSFYGTAGNFYGPAPDTFFHLTPSGVENVLYTFASTDKSAKVIQGADGNFYGTAIYSIPTTATTVGGQYANFFQISPTGVKTVLNDMISPPSGGPIIQGNDGNFYVPTNDYLLEMTPSGTATDFSALAVFGGGASGLMQLADGNFYATAGGGAYPSGTYQSGSFFRISAQGVGTNLYSFYDTADYIGSLSLSFPGGLVQGSGGNFYAATSSVLYRITPAGVAAVIYVFDSPQFNGVSLMRGTDGSVYVATGNGGPHGAGELLKFVP